MTSTPHPPARTQQLTVDTSSYARSLARVERVVDGGVRLVMLRIKKKVNECLNAAYKLTLPENASNRYITTEDIQENG